LPQQLILTTAQSRRGSKKFVVSQEGAPHVSACLLHFLV
jgi:hypothetical protein